MGVAVLRLKSFGGLALERDGQVVSGGASRRRPLAFLILLAAARERAGAPGAGGMTRDKLASYLWRDSDADSARHALAQTLYSMRRELDPEAVVTTGNDLSLNPAVVSTDLWEFDAALAKGQCQEAIALYSGPFLDGFYVSEAPEFERWAEEQRGYFAQRYRGALEALAAEAEARKDLRAAADWRRRLVTADPLDSRLALLYMKALAGIGDRAAAIRHAHVHETLLKQELRLQPDAELRAFTRALRETEPESAAASAPAAVAAASAVRAEASASFTPTTPEPDSHAQRATPTGLLTSSMVHRMAAVPRRKRLRIAGVVLAAALVVAAVAFAIRPRSSGAVPTAAPVIAVGAIREYGGTDTSGIVRALAEMLSTNVARIPGLPVISNARVYELLGQMGDSLPPEGIAARMERAAQRAGATEIVEGSLFRLPNSLLRFDLRRVDLATATVRAAYSVQGPNLFVLVDSATALLARDLVSESRVLRVADVTTPSLVAHRFYDEGLRTYYQQSDARAALRFFQLALREDSTFAMAAFYAAVTGLAVGDPSYLSNAQLALRLAGHASERERLMINAEMRHIYNDPLSRDYADSLSRRFPNEIDGHYLLAVMYEDAGNFIAAVPLLRRVIAMDSASLSGGTTRCRACDAYGMLFEAYWHADSMAAAERVARELLAHQPNSPGATGLVGRALEYQGRGDDAIRYLTRATELGQGRMLAPSDRAIVRIREGRLSEAEQLLGGEITGSDVIAGERENALWFQIIDYRYQGRLRDAERLCPKLIAMSKANDGHRQACAQVLIELGRNADAARIFDSLAAHPTYPMKPRRARQISWNLAHVATAVAAMGDTMRLKRLADSLQFIGGQSAWGRDTRLHYYARGLLQRARRDEAGAVDQFRRAIYAPSDGFTLVNLELGRSLMALGRPADAVPVLRAALHGSLESSNLYVTHTELHEALAKAFDESRQPDSAAAHYRWVVGAWQHADPMFAPRYQHARARLAALARR